MYEKKQGYQPEYSVWTSPPNRGSSVRGSRKIIELEKRIKRLEKEILGR